VIRRSTLALLAGLLALGLAPSAYGQAEPPFFAFEHDSSRDGTANEVRSGFYGGDDGDNSNGDPLADRVPNSYETFEFQVPAGSSHGSFNVHVEWVDPQIDLDLYVYRLRPDGSLVSNSVASSASFGDNTEDAEYRPPIGTVEPDRYLIVVDNWCSSPTDPGSSPAACGFAAEKPDEDDFSGEVRFGGALISNQHPTVSLAGPDSGRVGDPLTFTAAASDADGRIVNHAFDFDGDGFFETNALESNTATHRFPAGVWYVGVRVIDNAGDKAFARRTVTVGNPAAPGGGTLTPADLGPLSSFKLSGPAFGGVRSRSLVVRYRLRERAAVTLTLYRGRRAVRTLARGDKRPDRTYRIVVRPRRLARGIYTVRIAVRPADGGRVVRARLASKKL
jgi:hypothetical protein